jgi:hypothetical protein
MIAPNIEAFFVERIEKSKCEDVAEVPVAETIPPFEANDNVQADMFGPRGLSNAKEIGEGKTRRTCGCMNERIILMSGGS